MAVSTLGRERLTLGAQAVGFQEVLSRQWAAAVREGRAESGSLREAYAQLWARCRLLRLNWLRALGGPEEGMEDEEGPRTHMYGAIAAVPGGAEAEVAELSARLTPADAG